MRNKKNNNQREKTSVLVHGFFIFCAICCIAPLWIVISVSLTSNVDLGMYGFSMIPRNIDTSAYAYVFANPKQIIDSYLVTIFISAVGTLLSVFLMTMLAYPLSKKRYVLKTIVTWYIYFPTLFSGGLVSSYLINTKYLHLTDSVWVLILPGLCSVYNAFMIRTFFSQLPESLFDAAKIDGAGEWRCFFTLALRLSKPVIATVSFLGFIGRWNSWYEAMIYIRSSEKYPLQYLLQKMLMNMQEIIRNMQNIPTAVSMQELPTESIKMALLVVCIGPMMIFFPFFQKYFTKGMTLGAVKG